jgi:hypothetical protein
VRPPSWGWEVCRPSERRPSAVAGWRSKRDATPPAVKGYDRSDSRSWIPVELSWVRRAAEVHPDRRRDACLRVRARWSRRATPMGSFEWSRTETQGNACAPTSGGNRTGSIRIQPIHRGVPDEFADESDVRIKPSWLGAIRRFGCETFAVSQHCATTGYEPDKTHVADVLDGGCRTMLLLARSTATNRRSNCRYNSCHARLERPRARRHSRRAAYGRHSDSAPTVVRLQDRFDRRFDLRNRQRRCPPTGRRTVEI